MPHSSRRKARLSSKPSHQKGHISTPDEDGWSTVISPRRPPSSSHHNHHAAALAPAPPLDDTTLSTLSASYTHILSSLQVSAFHTALTSLIAGFDHPLPKVRRAVVFGLGSPSSSRGKIALAQIAGLEVLLSLFPPLKDGEKEWGGKVVVQDPIFNTLDEEWFAKERGFDVARDPEAQGILSEDVEGGVLVYAPHCEGRSFLSWMEGVTRKGLVVVANDMREEKNARSFLKGMRVEQWPEWGEVPWAFGDMCLYTVEE